jgi:2-C-methyl-D-erythritol 4-phosphate cytidylyltransferase/2-C-methyl-D-erythritol 2,4-cyclodiphosphate synthase
MHVTAIIAAGGRGQRFGAAQPKQLTSIGGRPILERSVSLFLAHPSIDAVVVALPQALVDDPPEYLRSAEAFARRPGEGAVQRPAGAVPPHPSGKTLRLVAGGDRRQDSVGNAFRAVDVASDIIVIHDAARPFASADLIARTIAAAAESGAAVAAIQARDTVKRVAAPSRGAAKAAPDGNDMVAETLPRETIFLAQTPQAFRRDVLQAALAAGEGADATDEAALAERAGHHVRIVAGEETNIKVTTPGDLPIAEAIAAIGSRSAIRNLQSAMLRVGTGYDLHRLVDGRPLVLGGVTIPSSRGALGHSDADVVCHAVTDAILGAACLGDIGRHFPDTDPRWKDASSLDLLQRAAALVAEQGLEVGNVDVTVILEKPKIKDHVDAMRAAVAQAIGIDTGRVSIKGKTNEGVDAVGRGEAVAAHAVALIRAI